MCSSDLAAILLAAGTAVAQQPPPPPPGPADGMARPDAPPPPPPHPGPKDAGPGEDGPRGHMPPPPPSKGAHFRLEQGDIKIDVKCADDEPMKACSDILMQLIDKINE